MTTSGATAAAVGTIAARTSSRAAWRGRAFYLTLTLVLIATVIRGFWPTYFGPLARGVSVNRHWVLHLHGAVFTGWMVLLLAQVLLVAAGRVRLHRRVGSLGIAYGALVFVMGVVVTFVAPVLRVRAGAWSLDAAAAFLILPIGDMLLFGGFFGAAVAYRRRPEIHKRLIVAATVALAFAAVARMFETNLGLMFGVWLAPLAAAVAFDLYTVRRVHPVNAIAAVVLVVAFGRIFVMNSEPWLQIGRALLAPFL